jgi:hypothetical protein
MREVVEVAVEGDLVEKKKDEAVVNVIDLTMDEYEVEVRTVKDSEMGNSDEEEEEEVRT